MKNARKKYPAVIKQPPHAHTAKSPWWRSSAHALFVMAFIGLTLPRDAHAYLDPGTGSILIQGLIVAVATCLMVGRTYWSRLKGFYKKYFQANSSQKTVEGDPERSGDG